MVVHVDVTTLVVPKKHLIMGQSNHHMSQQHILGFTTGF
jgi:hypothetical protein